jgi:hypothetical protein
MSDIAETKGVIGVTTDSLSQKDGASDQIVSDIFIDPAMEKQTMRKFDIYILPQFALLAFMMFVDRSNIGNARVFGFEESLSLTGNQFGDIVMIFYAAYVIFEIPWVVAWVQLLYRGMGTANNVQHQALWR